MKGRVLKPCFSVWLSRKMYWTDQGTESGIPAKVASANMDGSEPRNLFTGSLDHVEFITIDIKENKLYWAVTSTGMVNCIATNITIIRILKKTCKFAI